MAGFAGFPLVVAFLGLLDVALEGGPFEEQPGLFRAEAAAIAGESPASDHAIAGEDLASVVRPFPSFSHELSISFPADELAEDLADRDGVGIF